MSKSMDTCPICGGDLLKSESLYIATYIADQHYYYHKLEKMAEGFWYKEEKKETNK